MAGASCCASLIAHTAFLILRIGEGGGYEIYVTRSDAHSLREWPEMSPRNIEAA